MISNNTQNKNKEQEESLNDLNQLILTSKNKNDLELLIDAFINYFVNLETIEQNVYINILFSHLFLKILTNYKNNIIPNNIEVVLLLILDNSNIKDFYFEEIKEISTKLKLLKVVKKTEIMEFKDIKINTENISNTVKINLDKLISDQLPKNKSKFSKRMGLSLLDLNGNFIWNDDISHKLFEKKYITKNGINQINLFDLMIPDSKLFLYQKFGKNLFDLDNLNVKNNIIFSYVIYSYSRLNNLVKIKKNSNKFNYKKHNEIIDEKEIFYKYLNSLSSRASIVNLEFDKKYLDDFYYSSNINIKLTNKMINFIQSQKDTNKVNFYAILLETRQSKFIPKFNYKKLINDEIIMKFEQTLKNKLEKQIIKENKKGLLKNNIN